MVMLLGKNNVHSRLCKSLYEQLKSQDSLK